MLLAINHSVLVCVPEVEEFQEQAGCVVGEENVFELAAHSVQGAVGDERDGARHLRPRLLLFPQVHEHATEGEVVELGVFLQVVFGYQRAELHPYVCAAVLQLVHVELEVVLGIPVDENPVELLGKGVVVRLEASVLVQLVHDGVPVHHPLLQLEHVLLLLHRIRRQHSSFHEQHELFKVHREIVVHVQVCNAQVRMFASDVLNHLRKLLAVHFPAARGVPSLPQPSHCAVHGLVLGLLQNQPFFEGSDVGRAVPYESLVSSSQQTRLLQDVQIVRHREALQGSLYGVIWPLAH
mmetsp:Transcript_26225/g.49812  ORF Transcript_26225/g.49812 Transcript_26225/m.49812 type:complete len:294 (-) Transcript_26225:119-1000(-)